MDAREKIVWTSPGSIAKQLENLRNMEIQFPAKWGLLMFNHSGMTLKNMEIQAVPLDEGKEP